MKVIKKHLVLICIVLASVLLDLRQGGLFFTVLLVYGLFIRFLASEALKGRLRRLVAVVVWVSFGVTTFLFYYSNHYFPRGPMIDTGDVICENDGRGPCGEKFVEDTTYLDIPDWAKFFKESGGELLWLGLLFAGGIVSKINPDDRQAD